MEVGKQNFTFILYAQDIRRTRADRSSAHFAEHHACEISLSLWRKHVRETLCMINEAALVPAARAHAKECVTQCSNQNQFVPYMDWMNYYYCAFKHSSSVVRVANAKGCRPERHRCIFFVHEKFEVVLLILEPAGLNHASRTVRLPRDTRTFFWQVVGHSAVVIEIFS